VAIELGNGESLAHAVLLRTNLAAMAPRDGDRRHASGVMEVCKKEGSSGGNAPDAGPRPARRLERFRRIHRVSAEMREARTREECAPAVTHEHFDAGRREIAKPGGGTLGEEPLVPEV